MFAHIYVHMAKVISISDEVYEMLKSMKRENESFSDVIKRLARRTTIKEFSGVLRKETAEEILRVRDELNRKIKEEF